MADDAAAAARAQRESAQRARAIEAITAIHAGADVTEEATRLANEFTDRQESRLRSAFRRNRRGGAAEQD